MSEEQQKKNQNNSLQAEMNPQSIICGVDAMKGRKKKE